jgi:hypothetical protein
MPLYATLYDVCSVGADGYRGHDCCSNIVVNTQGKIIYPVCGSLWRHIIGSSLDRCMLRVNECELTLMRVLCVHVSCMQTASLMVAYDERKHTQNFFQACNDDIVWSVCSILDPCACVSTLTRADSCLC